MSENESGRELINSVVIDEATTGRPVAHLYSAQTQLQYPVLDLFDLSALRDIGIDPNEAPRKERIYVRAWAYYQVSDKTKRTGNPYRDVTHLEPLTNGQAELASAAEPVSEATSAAAQATSDEACPERSDRILAELRAIRKMIADVYQTVLELRYEDIDPNQAPFPQGEEPAEPTQPVEETDEDPVLRYANGHAASDNEAELAAFVAFLESMRRKPNDIQELRAWKLAQLQEEATD